MDIPERPFSIKVILNLELGSFSQFYTLSLYVHLTIIDIQS